jgi:glycosyltransferase involved in cell wall biosynthesis
MIRVLHIARYRHPTMERKLVLMAAEPDLELWLVRPVAWQDEYGSITLHRQTCPEQSRRMPSDATQEAVRGIRRVPMLGRPNDPHRGLYRTLTFGMAGVKPHIIHVEEEPDSLAALQIVLARGLVAPASKLILHTWQNVLRPLRWYVRAIAQAVLRQADGVLCANHAGASVLAQLGYRGVTEVIPPIGVDLQVFQPGVAQDEPRIKDGILRYSGGAAPNAFTVLYAGRFVPEKGLDLLIDALRLLGPTAQLRLVGQGPSTAALKAQAQAAGVAEQVRFSPPVSPDRMPANMAQADVLVLPSRSTPVWQEQFGRVLIEAMACKVPVVGSDSGAIPEVIGDAGLVFPEGNASALADRLRQLMATPALRAELAERGYARAVAHFSQERVAQQTAAFYRRLLSLHAKLALP